MAIDNQEWRWTYQPNGVTTAFPFTNLVLAAGDLSVKWYSSAGVELTLPSYSVSGVGVAAGGNVVFSSAPAATAGSLLVIERVTARLQSGVFQDFLQEAAETRQMRSDRGFAVDQELWGQLQRVIRLSPFDTVGPITLPPPALRINKYLMGGADGSLMFGSALAAGVLAVSAFIQTLLDDNDGPTALGTLGFSAFVKGLVNAADAPAFRTAIGAIDSVTQLPPPQGRLTLASGQAVMTGNQTGKTALLYTPYVGNLAPIWDGAKFVATAFAELSNDLTQSSVNKAGPAAAGPYQVIDGFVWNDGGTVRLSRGPKWRKGATVTMTSASPCVVTWNGHALYDGATVRFTTTGALYTGLTANTDYFVTRIDANTFKLSTSLANQVAGTFINTSGAQSGVHTGENYTTTRGAGAGTAELERLGGIWVNRYDITNGPLARMGTYVGCIVTDGSSQANWQTGGIAAGGTAAILGVWNAYNRVRVTGMVGDSTDSWPYATATARPANGSATARAWCLYGLQEDIFAAQYQALRNDGSPSNEGYCGVLYNSSSAFSGRLGYFGATSVSLSGSGDHQAQHVGWGFMSAGERGNGVGTGTWFGDNGTPSTIQTGLRYECNC